MKGSEYTITQVYQDVKTLNFVKNWCNIKECIEKQLEESDIVKIS